VPDSEHFPHVDPARSGLRPIACETFEGFVFLNLSPQPEQSLEAFLGGLGEIIRGMPFDHYPLRVRFSGVIKANWKACVDSQSEGYHVQALHLRSVRDIIVSKANPFLHFGGTEFYGPHRSGTVGGNDAWRPTSDRPVQKFTFEGLSGSVTADAGAKGGHFIGHPGTNRSKVDNWVNEAIGVFPNWVTQPGTGGYYTQHYWPLTVDSCYWEANYYYEEPETLRDRFCVEGMGALMRDILAEDYLAVERQQQMLASGAITTLQFGEGESLLRHLAAVLSAVGKASYRRQWGKSIAAE
jgi:phenylpropionate dioxygenase-like ring-hydroxylating dioxygenase large terminal subunit